METLEEKITRLRTLAKDEAMYLKEVNHATRQLEAAQKNYQEAQARTCVLADEVRTQVTQITMFTTVGL